MGQGMMGEVNDGKKDGWTEGWTKRKKERETDERRALSSHCPGRNSRMFVTDTTFALIYRI
jgi:hypothetical protein